METGVEPLHLAPLAQPDHGNAHRETPVAQCRFEKFPILLTRQEYDRIDAIEEGFDVGQDALRPPTPFPDSHRIQRSLVGPDLFVRMEQAVLSRQDAPWIAGLLDESPGLPEPRRYIEILRGRTNGCASS